MKNTIDKHEFWGIELTEKCLLLPALVHKHTLFQQRKLIIFLGSSHRCYLWLVIAYFGKIFFFMFFVKKKSFDVKPILKYVLKNI